MTTRWPLRLPRALLIIPLLLSAGFVIASAALVFYLDEGFPLLPSVAIVAVFALTFYLVGAGRVVLVDTKQAEEHLLRRWWWLSLILLAPLLFADSDDSTDSFFAVDPTWQMAWALLAAAIGIIGTFILSREALRLIERRRTRRRRGPEP
jgi:hypothetical protein